MHTETRNAEIKTAHAMIALALAALTTAGAAEAAPLASHDAAFFERLLVDRAYVYKKTLYRRGDIAGYVKRPGGKVLICTYRGYRRVTQRANWRVLPSNRHRALSALYYDGDDPRDSRNYAVPFYDGESGRLHQKIWHRGDLRWVDRFDGWVQESWPRILADACPGLTKDLPEGMAINEKQTAERLEELRAQDPEAPLRRGVVEATP